MIGGWAGTLWGRELPCTRHARSFHPHFLEKSHFLDEECLAKKLFFRETGNLAVNHRIQYSAGGFEDLSNR